MSQSVEPLRPDVAVVPLPETAGGFKTVLADPPWRFTNRTGKVASRAPATRSVLSGYAGGPILAEGQ